MKKLITLIIIVFYLTYSGFSQIDENIESPPETITVSLPDLPADAKPLEMVYIQPGSFMMGSPEEEIEKLVDKHNYDFYKGEGPQHNVMITHGFYMGKYEVTQAQYEAVIGYNPSSEKGDNIPVHEISWYNALHFCNQLSQIKGLQKVYTLNNNYKPDLNANGYRLPTEAEWEYACRAGTQTRFYWGNDPDYSQIDEYAWYGGRDNSLHAPQIVGLKQPNPWGLFDMSGNIWEWCNDCYEKNYYSHAPEKDPANIQLSKDCLRVFRGGHFFSKPMRCRSAYRTRNFSDDIGWIGLRICKNHSETIPSQTPIPTSTPTPTPRDSSGKFIKVDMPNLPQKAKELEMSYIEPGTFLMGSPIDEFELQRNELPPHQVTLTQGFYLGKYEITVGQYTAFLKSTGKESGVDWSKDDFPLLRKYGNYELRGYPLGLSWDQPIVYVSWTGAAMFCNYLSEKEGLQPVYIESENWKANLNANGYRLPTEAEWEYACLANTHTRYYWGDDIDGTKINNYAWYHSNSLGLPHNVGSKRPNPWGLFDMSGNAWEWCTDRYQSDYYYHSPEQDPVNLDPSYDNRVIRGGSYDFYYQFNRSRYRKNAPPASVEDAFGFRVCKPELESTPPEEPTFTPTPTPKIEPAATPTPSPEDNGEYGKIITIPLSGLPSDSKPLEMVYIEEGTFMMGSSDAERGHQDYESPQHKVTLTNGFYFGKYEITQAQYKAITSKNPSYHKGNNRPVESITWQSAIKCCNALSEMEGLNKVYHKSNNWEADLNANGYRLPTEAEWEYACRAGSQTRFSYGDVLECKDFCEHCDIHEQYTWYCANSCIKIQDGSTTSWTDCESWDVGLKLPNPWGLFDMHGNVLEMCTDWYDSEYYTILPQTDPANRVNTQSTDQKVIRGGNYASSIRWCRSACRDSIGISFISASIGFRICRTASGMLTPTPTPTPTQTPMGKPLTVPLFNLSSDAKPLELVYIKPGTFKMGSPDDEIQQLFEDTRFRWYENETPQHKVTLTHGFYIGKYEITNAQFNAVMANPSKQYGNNKPKASISWYDAARFCNALSQMQGLQTVYSEKNDWPVNLEANGYRLPTEAEWEYACRAGTQTRFFWGDDPGHTEIDDYAWYSANCWNSAKVGQTLPNQFGLFDMTGNVWEWCTDWHQQNYYTHSPETDPVNLHPGFTKVLRGGGVLYSHPKECRSAFRLRYMPSYSSNDFGFRVCKTIFLD